MKASWPSLEPIKLFGAILLELERAVRYRKLRAAGVEAVLQVWEGQSHVQYLADPSAPETKEYHEKSRGSSTPIYSEILPVGPANYV